MMKRIKSRWGNWVLGAAAVAARACAVLAAVLLFAGCHLIYPFDHSSGVTDAGVPDASGTDVSMTETGATEAGATDACVDPSPFTLGSCPAKCPGAVSGEDKDCDGLKDAVQDPWPACNGLMLGEEFAAPPWLRWEMSYPPSTMATGPSCGSGRCEQGDTCSGGTSCRGLSSWRCNALRFKHGQTLTLTDPGTLWDPAYMVELRLQFETITVNDKWGFGVIANISADTSGKYRRSCEIWRDKSYTQVPGLHINHTLTSGFSSGTWTPDAWDKIGDPQGRGFLLQLWYDKTEHTCRLLSGDGLKVLSTLTFSNNHAGRDFTPPLPGSIQVRASGCEVSLEHVRVFHAP